MISRNQQRLISIGVVALAVLALGLGVAYQGERLPDDDPAVGQVTDETPAPPEGVGGTTSTTGSTGAIEGFLPRSGEASACREPVGVDLRPGYAATLTINGITIGPDEMNEQDSASRSIGQFTFGPEDDCPNGRVLRATDNVLKACVYRLEDGPVGCVTSENDFDVL